MKSEISRYGCAIVGVFASLACGAAAFGRGEIAYDSFSGTTINFDSMNGSGNLGSGEQLTNQYAGQGVTFATQTGYGAYANISLANLGTLQSDPNVIWVNQGSGGTTGAGGLDVFFSGSVNRLGLWFGGSLSTTYTFTAYSGSTMIESITKQPGVVNTIAEDFFAIEEASGITRFNIACSPNSGPASYNFAIDDLKFQVPAPASAGVLGMAGLVLGGRRRR